MGEEKQPVRRVSKKARKRTRILIAYDGSSCARSALEDLSRAGLPQEVDALVVSVSEVWLPPPLRNELAGKVFVEDIPSIPGRAANGVSASLATEAVEASRLVRDILHDIEPTFSSLRVQSEPVTITNVVEAREGARLMPSGLSGADSGTDGEIRTNQTKHLEEVASQAYEAADILRSSFPDWDVQVQTCHGSPATALLEKADEWRPDLIVVGSHGRSAIGRLFLGSVSHKIAIEAKCSVRIARDLAREPRTSAARILIAVDGSPGSTAAVQAVGARVWPTGSEARLVAVYDSVTPTMAGNFIPPVMQWVEDENKLSIKRAREMVVSMSQSLRSSRLNISIAARPGDPKKVIVAEAQSWKANCIFVGATGLSPLDRFLLGSVSAAIASRAHCSVEIVRVPANLSRQKSQRRRDNVIGSTS